MRYNHGFYHLAWGCPCHPHPLEPPDNILLARFLLDWVGYLIVAIPKLLPSFVPILNPCVNPSGLLVMAAQRLQVTKD